MRRSLLLCLLLTCPALAQDTPLTPRQSARMREAFEEVRKANAGLKKQRDQLREQIRVTARDYRAAVEFQLKTLLQSKQPKLQRMGLELLLQGQEQLPNLGIHSAPPGIYRPDVEAELTALAESSDAEVKKLAIRGLIAFRFQAGIRLGYQTGYSIWRSVEGGGGWGAREDKVQQALHESLPLRGDYTIQRLVDESKPRIGVSLQADAKLDRRETYRFDTIGLSLLEYTEDVLDPAGVTVLAGKDGILLLPVDDPRAALLRTYQVRGIVEGGVPLKRIVELLGKTLDDRAEIAVKGPHTVIVRTRLTQQRRAERVLGRLAPKVNVGA